MLRKMIKSLLKSEYHGVTPLIADNTIQDTFNESEYAKYDPNSGRRESWNDLCIRNAQMHIKKYPQLEKEIWEVYARSVLPKKVVPAMRSFQFAGKAIEKNNTRMYNCSAIAVDEKLEKSLGAKFENSYNYFENRDCEFFPCHNGIDVEKDGFNCMFCRCPQYHIENCAGIMKCEILKPTGIKDCTNCEIPHKHCFREEMSKS